MMRQIAGAFADYEKARLVSKLRHARERVRQEKGKCEGASRMGSCDPRPSPWRKRLHRASPKTGKRMSLRKIAAALAEAVISMSVGSHSTQKACAACLTRSADSDGLPSRQLIGVDRPCHGHNRIGEK